MPTDPITPAPLHPHPIANELTDESLPPRSPREEAVEAEGLGPGRRHVVKVIGGVVVFLVSIGLIGTAIMLGGERWELILIGAILFVLYIIFIGAPLLLAAGTKAAQDEAVRDERTHPEPKSTTADAAGPSSAEARTAEEARAAVEARAAAPRPSPAPPGVHTAASRSGRTPQA